MSEEISWNKLFECREQIHQMYRDIWNIKILRKRFPLIVRTIADGERILDIGASNRNLEKRLKHHFPNLIYKSMDIDRDQFHDFYSMEEIRETFDVIFLLDVIEHLEFEEGVRLLKRSYDLLNEGGRLIVATPNVFNPGRFWRDATHRVAYCYHELGGLLLARGFSIRAMYRTYNDVFHRYFFRVYVMAPVHRYLGVDFAKSILIVAEKKSDKAK